MLRKGSPRLLNTQCFACFGFAIHTAWAETIKPSGGFIIINERDVLLIVWLINEANWLDIKQLRHASRKLEVGYSSETEYRCGFCLMSPPPGTWRRHSGDFPILCVCKFYPSLIIVKITVIPNTFSCLEVQFTAEPRLLQKASFLLKELVNRHQRWQYSPTNHKVKERRKRLNSKLTGHWVDLIRFAAEHYQKSSIDC